MKTEIVPADNRAPAVQAAAAIELTAIQADVLLARRQAVEKVVKELMVEDVHYGPVPGVPDSMMLDKAGSELLAATFQLAFDYEVTEHENAAGDRRYVSTCTVTHQPSGIALGSGMGEASTAETKFAWHKVSSKAEYDEAPEDRRREKTYTKKKGGGSYVVQQIRELTDDKANTVLKMANKRAASDAVQAVLGVRGMILQGVTPGKGQNAANAAPKPVGEEAVAELVRFAALKGVVESRLLSTLKRDGYSGRLEDISAAEYGYLAAELFILPDKVDAVTGEIVEQAPDDPQHTHHSDDVAASNLPTDTERAQGGDDDIGFEGEDAPGTDGEAPGHDAASFKAKNEATAAKPKDGML